MVNILLEEHDIDNDYLYNDLKEYIMTNSIIAKEFRILMISILKFIIIIQKFKTNPLNE